MGDTDKIAGVALDRRNFLKGAAAAAAGATLGVSPLLASRAYAGQELNLTIIQPHAVTGEYLKKEFLEKFGVTLNFTVIPYDQIQAQATLDVQSGANRFDVHDYWYATIGALAEDKVVEDLTDLIEKDKALVQPEDFLPAIYDPYSLVNGRRYGLPYDGDTHLLYYNNEILARNGIAVPKTWDDYYNAVKLITEKEKANGIYGAAVLGFKVPIILISTYGNRLAGFGGSFLKDGKPNLLSEEAIAAAEELVRVAPYALPTPSETAFEQGLPAFLAGKTAFIEFWSDLGVRAQDPANSKIVDKWGAAPVPLGGNNKANVASLNAGFGWAISTGSKKKALAWEFVRWATSADVTLQLLTLQNSGIDPARTSGLNADSYKAFAPKVQAAIAASSKTLIWPNGPQSPKLLEALTEQLSLALNGQIKPKDALAAAQKEWEHLLA
ncbi:ABC transporter substrate-binding protein [Rhodomicrobium lacus]|uniref:ABC transporter substrate-binding protein n=1 Tax=Rhodomicrobium lacus TaxID=2498452 RepID=UPI0026E19C83|nr:sugar ABC transporter substrate-binding protein [Rhodomicrobium lacus]WKW52107.1 sugar ABC transporter substrate-binding protein [Rhodomicrobium lacus]